MQPENQKLKIRWIVDWKAEGPTPTRSPIASMRYRVLLPARALEAKGHQVEIVKLQDLRDGQQLSWQSVDVLVVGKLFVDINMEQFKSDSQRLLQACRAAREAGAPAEVGLDVAGHAAAAGLPAGSGGDA